MSTSPVDSPHQCSLSDHFHAYTVQVLLGIWLRIPALTGVSQMSGYWNQMCPWGSCSLRRELSRAEHGNIQRVRDDAEHVSLSVLCTHAENNTATGVFWHEGLTEWLIQTFLTISPYSPCTALHTTISPPCSRSQYIRSSSIIHGKKSLYPRSGE
jgi:hypothetical protein